MTAAATSQHIVFIDPRVSGYPTLVAQLPTSAEVVLLNTEQDGLTQMAAALAGRTGVAAIHVVSHGSAGALYLGDARVDGDHLQAHSAELASIGASLTDTGDILLYGCDVAQGDVGVQFVQSLVGLTGADVAASTDTTGPTALNGNGVLEATSGSIETRFLSTIGLEQTLGVNTVPTFVSSDGKVITDFSAASSDVGNSITLQADGKILVAGSSSQAYSWAGNDAFALVRYNADGTLDTTFDGSGKTFTSFEYSSATGQSITVQVDGKILVAGGRNHYSSYYGIYGNFALTRYNPDGSLDTNFGSSGQVTTGFWSSSGYQLPSVSGTSVTLQTDGKILVAGYSDGNFALVRYNSDGSTDTNFGSYGSLITDFGSTFDSGNSVIVQADGKIVVAGSSNGDFALARYNSDGTLDNSFSDNGMLITDFGGSSSDAGNSVIVQANGKIVVAGSSNGDFALARYNSDGTLDNSFSGNGMLTTDFGGSSSDAGNSVIVQSDGKIVVAGSSNDDFALARYNSDGTLDNSFSGDGLLTTDFGASIDTGSDVTLQADGKIVVAGSSNDDFAVARYNSDGSLDSTFLSLRHVTYTEGSWGQVGIPVALAPRIEVKDAELAAIGHYAGATLTLARHGGASAEDVFSATGTLSSLTAGSFFSIEGATIGRVTQNAGGSLALVFNTNATEARVTQALRQIAYSNTSDTPLASVKIDWAFSDGNTGSQGSGGAMSVTSSSTVSITPANDPPVRNVYWLPAQTTSNGEQFSYSLPANTFSDPDGDTLTYSITMRDGSGVPPWLSIDSATGTLSGTPDIWDVGALDLTITASDSGGLSESNYTLQIHVNGRPTGDVLIVGEPVKNQPFTATSTLEDLDGLGYISYQWQANGININGATGSVFSPTPDEVGKTLTVTANYTDAKGMVESVTSAPSAVVAAGENMQPSFGMGNGKITTDLGTFSDFGYGVTLQADGKILVTGSSYNNGNYSYSSDFALVRYNPDGTLDASFSGDGKQTTDFGFYSEGGNSVTVQADGKIVVAGSVRYYNDSAKFALVRYNPDGTLDTSFDGDGMLTTGFSDYNMTYGQSVTVQSDGKILVAGAAYSRSYYYADTKPDFALVRYNPDGTPDTSFSNDGMLTTDFGAFSDWANSVALQSDGKILVAGYSGNNYTDFALARYNPDGTLDTSFSGDGVLTTDFDSFAADFGSSVTVQADGKILLVGSSNYDFALVRYNPDGTLDSSFSGDGMLTTDFGSTYDNANSVAVQADGKILVAGSSSYGNYDFALARYNPDGSLDISFSGDGILTTDFNSGFDSCYGVAVQADGKILVTGYSSSGNYDFALARYNPDGSLDLNFDMAGVLGGSVHYTEQAPAVVLDNDVQIYDPELSALDNYSGATVTLSRHDGAQAEDVFSGAGIVAGQASGDLTVDTTAIGTYIWTAGTLNLVFNSQATQAKVNQALQAIAYQNASHTPTSSIQIDWVFSDGNTGTQGTGGNLTATGSTTVNITAVNDAPTGSVTVTGTAIQGQTLTAVHALADQDGMGTVSYQWLADGNPMSDATGSKLSLGQTLVGKVISVVASYTDALGTTERVISSSTSAVSNLNDAPIGSVTITGIATQGQTLTAGHTLADADGLGTVSYQWLADGAAISGATGSTLVLAQAQVGKAISVTASYTDGFGTTESVSSSVTAAVANINDAPTGSVSITGTATQGQTLTAGHTLADADGLGTVSYQWLADGVVINGATGGTFDLMQQHVGRLISVRASYTDSFGTAESITSVAKVVANVNDAPTGAVSITGTATQGQALTASHTLADIDGLGTLSYQWLADGAAISGATGVNFKLTQAQVGREISVRVGYADGQGTAESVTSAATAAVANVNDLPTGTVTLTGTAVQNQTLTVTNSLADVDGMGTVSYQWLANGAALEGATGTSLALGQALVGKTISVQARYTDGFGTEEVKTSRVTAAVANVNDAPTGSVTISGAAQQGQTLTATSTLADVDGLGALKYQWLAGGVAIAGATGSTFTLKQAQVGKAISVTVKYTDGFNKLETVSSAATAAVVNVNDAPTFSNLPVNKQPVFAGYASALNDFKVADVDGGTLSLTLLASNGTIGGLVDADANTAGIQLSGTIASLNKALAAATFNASSVGAASVALSLSDGVAQPVTATYALQAGFKVQNGDANDNALSGGNGMDQLSGNDGNDSLNGGAGQDKLLGGNGNDTLNGGAGVDNMNGGLGNDTYYVDVAGDVVTESNDAVNGGIDTVFSGVTRTLGAFQENLTLTGAKAINGTGNTLNNVLLGNAGANQLTGAAGNDTLTGGLGKDVLSGGAGADTFVFNAAAESTGTTKDTILDFVSGTDLLDLRGMDETFTFIGKAAFSSTNATGQLRFSYSAAGNFVVVSGSTDADVQAEFSVQLNGVSTLTAADFLL